MSNDALNIKGGGALLKNFYPVGKKPKVASGPVAQMNASMPMISAIRQKRDLIGRTNLMQDTSQNKIMKPPGKPMVPQGGLKHPPAKRRGF